jgi:hypothetical protein
MKTDEKIYTGRSHRFIIEQTIGFSKVVDCLKEKFEVEELSGSENKIVLVEERSPKPADSGK